MEMRVRCVLLLSPFMVTALLPPQPSYSTARYVRLPPMSCPALLCPRYEVTLFAKRRAASESDDPHQEVEVVNVNSIDELPAEPTKRGAKKTRSRKAKSAETDLATLSATTDEEVADQLQEYLDADVATETEDVNYSEPTEEEMESFKQQFLQEMWENKIPEGFAEQQEDVLMYGDEALATAFSQFEKDPENDAQASALLDIIEQRRVVRPGPEPADYSGLETSLSQQVVAGANSLIERQQKAAAYLSQMLEEPYEHIFTSNFTCACGGPMSDEEKSSWGKCSDCRLQDLREPHADLSVRYAYVAEKEGWKYDPEPVPTRMSLQHRNGNGDYDDEFDEDGYSYAPNPTFSAQQERSIATPALNNDILTEILARLNRLEAELVDMRSYNEKICVLETRLDSVIKALDRLEQAPLGEDSAASKPSASRSKKK